MDTVLGAILGLGALAGAVAATLWARRRRARIEGELDRARRRLDAARAARTEFFDSATHELRSPLSAILGFQELLHDNAYGDLSDEARDAVDRIGRAGRHLLHLVDGVVELARLRAGDVAPDLEPVDLGVVAAAAADTFHRHASDRGIRPDITIPEDLPTIRTDRYRLIRALDLLITSAIRHPREDAMRLDLSVRDGHVRLALEPTILEIGDPPDGDPTGGLGIRLGVVHGIARLLGGSLDIDIDPRDGRARRVALRIPTAGPDPPG